MTSDSLKFNVKNSVEQFSFLCFTNEFSRSVSIVDSNQAVNRQVYNTITVLLLN